MGTFIRLLTLITFIASSLFFAIATANYSEIVSLDTRIFFGFAAVLFTILFGINEVILRLYDLKKRIDGLNAPDEA